MGVKDDKAEITLCEEMDVSSQFSVSDTAQTKVDCNSLKTQAAIKILIAVLAFVGGMAAAYMALRINDKIQAAHEDFKFGVPANVLELEVTPAMQAQFKEKEEKQRRLELESKDNKGKGMMGNFGSMGGSLFGGGKESPKTGKKPTTRI